MISQYDKYIIFWNTQVLRPLEKSDSAKLSSWDLWDLNESSGDRTNEFLRWDLWGPETFREIWFSEIELLRPLGFKRELLRQDKWVPEIFSVIEIPHKISRNQDLRCSKSAPLLRGPGARCGADLLTNLAAIRAGVKFLGEKPSLRKIAPIFSLQAPNLTFLPLEIY